MNLPSPQHISPADLHCWLTAKQQKPILVDVRESDELEMAAFPFPVVHLPLSQASVWSQDLPDKLANNSPIVVICHAGIRSLNFGTWLIQQDWGYEVWNLDGGIEAWSLNVDSSVPRY